MAPGLHHRSSLDHGVARRRRDLSLARVGTITKAIGAGTVVAVGAVGLYVSRALPGHQSSPTAATSAGTTSGASATNAPPSAAGSPNPSPTLAPPATAPVRSPAPARVSTGAS